MIQWKQFFITLFVVGVSFYLFSNRVFAAANTTLSFSSANPNAGDTFSIQILIDSSTSLITNTDLVIRFNQAMLEVIDISPGSFLPNATEIVSGKVLDNTNGVIKESFYTSRGDAKSGSGEFAKITFKARASGSTSVSIDTGQSIVYAVGGGNVLGSASDGSILVSAPPPPPANSGNGSSGGGGGGGGSGGGGGGSGGGGSSGGVGGAPASSGRGPDLNGDGRVNIFDLSILLRSFNRGGGSGDLNGDGRVNIFDLSILLRSFGR